MEISTEKTVKSRREKIRKSDFAPQKIFSCYTPVGGSPSDTWRFWNFDTDFVQFGDYF